MILFMRELARRLNPYGISTASTNPGAVLSPMSHRILEDMIWWTPKVSSISRQIYIIQIPYVILYLLYE